MPATVNIQTEVPTSGLSLTRYKEYVISDGKKKEVMTQEVAFFLGAVVVSVSDERSSRTYGTYRSVEVALESGPAYVIFAENRDKATVLVPGKEYNFEGTPIEGKRPMMSCLDIVKGNLTAKPNGKYRS